MSREGQIHHMMFERGRKSKELKVIGQTPRTGTKVSFKPDPTLFPDVNFVHETLSLRLRELAYLNSGVEIAFEDERVGKRSVFKFEDGLKMYVQHLNEGKNSLHDVIYFSKEDTVARLVVEVAMQYNDGYNETMLTFANNINNHDGGTHLSGFKTALTGTINRRAEQAKGWIKETRPSGDDLREGLIAIISVKLPGAVALKARPRTSCSTLRWKDLFHRRGERKNLAGFWRSTRRKRGRSCLRRGCSPPRRARRPARRGNSLAAKTALEGGGLPGKLADCRSKFQ